jgi:hypothetical protein
LLLQASFPTSLDSSRRTLCSSQDAAEIEALIKIVLATVIITFFRPCPSLLTNFAFTRPSSDNFETSRDTALGLRCDAIAKSPTECGPLLANPKQFESVWRELIQKFLDSKLVKTLE